MAQRRMFAKAIIDSDAFLEMPLTTQALYFHLSMRADDDGFINNPKNIQRLIGATSDDLKLLIAKNFIIIFDTGVIVIKHWRIHNYIQKDRYKETNYIDEKAQLAIKNNNAYTLKDKNGYKMDTLDTQVRLGKVSIGKDIYSSSLPNDSSKLEEGTREYKAIIDYLNEKAGTQYRYQSDATKRKIDARYNEGFTIDDFKKVIDIKVAEWKNNDMAKFLRPETLFGTKFESYLNQSSNLKDAAKPNYNYQNDWLNNETIDLDKALSEGGFNVKD